jgi:CheY-like chemotaxis protein
MLKNVREILARQVAHMTHLLDDLLEVGRLTGGKIVLERTPADLAPIAQQMLDAWTGARRFAHHQLAAKLSPVWATVDRVRIEQVLSNLLDNALKFTPAGGRIEVVVERRGSCAVLEVSDSGEGIPETLIGRMFDLFVQGERNLARQQGGLGIGLTMAKRLVELHDGTIVARSAGAGRGATFTVSLPAIERPEAPAAASANAVAAQRRILVVEDNPDARESLVALLRGLGHEVRADGDGESGVATAAAWTPDVALIDIGLPGIDGYEVARRLRARAGAPPIMLIALTGYGSADDQRRAFAAGFDAHLIKPLDLPLLDGLLARLAKVA